MGTYATLDKATTSANFSKAPQKHNCILCETT